MGSRRAILKGSLLEFSGLKCNLADTDFFKYVSNFDIVFLSETWQSRTETLKFDISGFHSNFISGNKSRNTTRGRHSGGLAVYYKNYLKNYISI